MTDTTTVVDGVTIPTNKYELLRDSIMYLAGLPFRRLLVYKIEVPLPLETGVTLFKVNSGFTISEIQVSVSEPADDDAAYILYDISDGETIGIAEVRSFYKNGKLPLAIPAVPADLFGPCTLYTKFLNGLQPTSGTLDFRVTVYGTADALGDGVSVDLNQD